MYKQKVFKDDIMIHNFIFSDFITIDNVKQFSKDIEILLEKKKAIYMILDVINIKNFDFKFFNEFNKIFKNKEVIRECIKGSTLLINSHHNFVNMIMSIKDQVVPTKVFGNYEDAINYLKNV